MGLCRRLVPEGRYDSLHSLLHGGMVEVRPFWEGVPGMKG